MERIIDIIGGCVIGYVICTIYYEFFFIREDDNDDTD